MNMLSRRQVKRVKRKRILATIIVGFIMLGFGTGAVFALLPFVNREMPISDDWGRFFGGVVLTCVALLLLWFFSSLLFLKKSTVERVQGKAQFVRKEVDDADGEGTNVSHYVVIGDHEFGVKKGQYPAFTQGHIYAIYLESNLGLILSLEYIGPPED